MCFLRHWLLAAYTQEAEETASEEEVGVGFKARGGAKQNPAAPWERPHPGSFCRPQPWVHGDEWVWTQGICKQIHKHTQHAHGCCVVSGFLDLKLPLKLHWNVLIQWLASGSVCSFIVADAALSSVIHFPACLMFANSKGPHLHLVCERSSALIQR